MVSQDRCGFLWYHNNHVLNAFPVCSCAFFCYECVEPDSLLFFSVTDETEMRFGGLVSTSNIVKGEKITVQSDSDLLWTITIKRL